MSWNRAIVALCIVAFSAVFAAGPAVAADEAAATAYRTGYGLVLDEDWAGAKKAFTALMANHAKSEWADDAKFWLCYVDEQQGAKKETVFACYESLLQKYEDSEWSDDARRNMVRLADQLAREGKPEYKERVKAFADDVDDAGVLIIIESLAEMGGEKAVTAILTRYDATTNETLRIEMVQILAEVGDPRTTERVVEAARNDSSMRVRESAVYALEDLDETISVPVLTEIVNDTSNPSKIRRAAIHSLRDFEGEETVALLKNIALTDPDQEVAESAVWALADLEDHMGFDALREILAGSTNNEVKGWTLRAIGDLHDPRAVEFLATVARTETDPEVATRAAEALGDSHHANAIPLLKEILYSKVDWRTRAAAIMALGDTENERAVTELAAYLPTENDPRLRRTVAIALGQSELDAAVDPLYQLAATDPDPQVRRMAVESLGEIESERARDALIRLLQEGKGE